MLPITLGFLGSQSGEKQKRKVFMFFLGQSLTFLLLGMVVVSTGEALGTFSENEYVNFIAAVVLIVAGVYAYLERVPSFILKINKLLPTRHQNKEGHSYISALTLGATTSIIASPCTTPILSGVLALMAAGQSFTQGIVLMGFYSIGFSSLLLIVGLGFISAKKLPKSGNWMNKISKISAVLLILVGMYFLGKAIYLVVNL
jgi:thiol:disulfide interchange protein DsbD